MIKSKSFPTEDDLRKTSRDLLKIYKFALNGYQENKLITSRQFAKVLGLKGRALGGVLAGSQKSNYTPILVRQGMQKITWKGKYESREQLWSINPQIPVDVIKAIKEILDQMFID